MQRACRGLPRSNADKRRAVEMLLADAEWAQWSASELSRRAHVSRPLIDAVRKSLAELQVTTPKYTTKHGTVATMRTENIGRVAPSSSRSVQTGTERAPEPTSRIA